MKYMKQFQAASWKEIAEGAEMRVYISKQPKCRYCGKLMSEWTLFLPEEEQAHPECEGKAMAESLLRDLQLERK